MNRVSRKYLKIGGGYHNDNRKGRIVTRVIVTAAKNSLGVAAKLFVFDTVLDLPASYIKCQIFRLVPCKAERPSQVQYD